jgi:uncharacterized membrane protein YvbJ
MNKKWEIEDFNMSFCPECGIKIENEENFCLNCGTTVRKRKSENTIPTVMNVGEIVKKLFIFLRTTLKVQHVK